MVASVSALAALAKTGLPLPAQACLAALTEGEGGDLPNRLYSGGTLEVADPLIGTDARGRLWLGDLSQFPAWHGATCPGGLSTAAGWLQFVGRTWRNVVAQTGRGNFVDDHFSNGWWLAQDDFRRRSGWDLLAALTAGQLALIPAYLGLKPNITWPGGAGLDFPKRYARNLTALQAPAPPPLSPVPLGPITLTLPATIVGTDESGTAVTIGLAVAPNPPASAAMAAPAMARIPAVAGAMALLLGLAGSQATIAPVPARLDDEVPRAAPFVLPVDIEPLATPYRGPAWRFGSGEAGHLAIECRRPEDGAWLVCAK